MKTTAATISKDHTNFLKTFESDQVELKIEGKKFTGLKENLGIETKATMWGMGQGFEMMVSFDVGDAKVKVDSASQVEVKIDGRWKEKSISRIESHSGSVYKVMIEDKYK